MKNFLLILLITIVVSAKENYELKLYKTILPRLFHKSHLIIYTQQDELINVFKNSRTFELSSHCENADLLLGKQFENLSVVCKEKPIFATTYRSYKTLKNCFGAFYWRKGRPQIKFKYKVIRQYNLSLPPSFVKYAK